MERHDRRCQPRYSPRVDGGKHPLALLTAIMGTMSGLWVLRDSTPSCAITRSRRLPRLLFRNQQQNHHPTRPGPQDTAELRKKLRSIQPLRGQLTAN